MLRLHMLMTPIMKRLAGVILAGAVLFFTACTPSQETVLRLDDQSRVYLLTGTDPWIEAPTPVLQNWTIEDFESALKRVMVITSSWFGIVDSDPQPLFKDSHVQAFTPMLVRYIPALRVDQRLRLRFIEPYQHMDVLADVYADGNFLVFAFYALGRDLESPGPDGGDIFNRAAIVVQSGQQLNKTPDLVTLKEPIARDLLELAKLRQGNLDIIDAAKNDNTLQEAEAERLREIVESADQLSDTQFERFMAKRRTLQQALKQSLFTEAEFDAKKEKLIEELKQNSAPANAKTKDTAADSTKGG